MKNMGVFGRTSALARRACEPISNVNGKILTWSALVACAALVVLPSSARAQAGKLDTTFGIRGIVTDSAGSFGTAAALQSDGKIVVGAQIAFEPAVLRLNINGSLDSTFGSGGAVTINFPGDDFGGAQISGLAIQSDGKIVAAISNLTQGFGPLFILTRLNPNGSLDPTFGSGGIVETQVGATGGSFGAAASVLALQPDGKILLAGQNSESAGSSGAIARYDNNGQLDDTFGSGGVAATPVTAPAAIALQPDGKILLAAGGTVVAFAATPPGVSFAQVAGSISRYNTNGSLDATFGVNGTAATVVVPGAIAVESDGVCSSTCKILVGGTAVTSLSINNGNSFGFGLARYSSNGSIDATFGQAGAATASFTPTEPDATLFALALQSNGDIVAAGTAGQAGTNPAFVTQADFALSRFTSSGVADSSFGSAGNVTTSFGSNEASIYALAIQKDGKIVAVGSSLSSVNPGSVAGGLVVARYLAQ